MIRRVAIRLVVYWIVACIVLAIVLGEMAFHPERVPIRNRADMRDVSITAEDGAVLSAWFARSAKPSGNAVILLHGVGDNRDGMMSHAELFLASGYSVLAPDSRAHGESGGAFPTYGIKEADDVRAWLEWTVANEHPACVFGLGESMGAAILLQSLRKENRFCAIVAESPFASFRDIAYIRVGQVFHVGPWLGRVVLRPAVELAFLYGRVTRGVSLANASPSDAVATTRVPILLIHGLADTNIPYGQSELIRERNPSVALWLVPHAGHCGAFSTAPEEFKKRVLEFFRSAESAKSAVSVPASRVQ